MNGLSSVLEADIVEGQNQIELFFGFQFQWHMHETTYRNMCIKIINKCDKDLKYDTNATM